MSTYHLTPHEITPIGSPRGAITLSPIVLGVETSIPEPVTEAPQPVDERNAGYSYVYVDGHPGKEWSSPVTGKELTGFWDDLGPGYDRGSGNFVGKASSTNMFITMKDGEIVSVTVNNPQDAEGQQTYSLTTLGMNRGRSLATGLLAIPMTREEVKALALQQGDLFTWRAASVGPHSQRSNSPISQIITFDRTKDVFHGGMFSREATVRQEFIRRLGGLPTQQATQ